MKRALLGLVVLIPATVLIAQHQHPTPAPEASAQASHHAFLEQERQAIERGEGFGMAMVADKAGYPGPKHVLELRKELGITDAQAAEMEKLRAAMKTKAIERGRDVLAAEVRLEQMFREGRTPDELREESFRIASLRAELRWVHLNTHLAARKVLTPEQLAKYVELRHGGEHSHAH